MIDLNISHKVGLLVSSTGSTALRWSVNKDIITFYISERRKGDTIPTPIDEKRHLYSIIESLDDFRNYNSVELITKITHSHGFDTSNGNLSFNLFAINPDYFSNDFYFDID